MIVVHVARIARSCLDAVEAGRPALVAWSAQSHQRCRPASGGVPATLSSTARHGPRTPSGWTCVSFVATRYASRVLLASTGEPCSWAGRRCATSCSCRAWS
jgi:hypothetical protein